MIKDSGKRQFDAVLVYQLDRFARNREDSAVNKMRLRKNGVKVLSARENVNSGDASDILMESVLEGMAEYYSVELSQKIRRGISLSVEQGRALGSVPPFGYIITEAKRYAPDPQTARIVPRIFELYAAGCSLKEVGETIAEQYGQRYFGNVYNSLGRILGNPNYIGTYTRGGFLKENVISPLVSRELFDRVQLMRAKKKKTPASARAYEDYILTTKLFCGYDREMMVGTGGTSKTGATFHYYGCKNRLKHKCKKKNVKKSYIEDLVVAEARKYLTDDFIAEVAKIVCDMAKREGNAPIIAELKRKLKENAKAVENLLVAIEGGQHIDLLAERITQKKEEKAALEIELAREALKGEAIEESEVGFFLTELKKGNVQDEACRRALVAVFINEVYLYDDRMTIIFNVGGKPVTVDKELLDEIEKGPFAEGSRCSYMMNPSPFKLQYPNAYPSG